MVGHTARRSQVMTVGRFAGRKRDRDGDGNPGEGGTCRWSAVTYYIKQVGSSAPGVDDANPSPHARGVGRKMESWAAPPLAGALCPA